MSKIAKPQQVVMQAFTELCEHILETEAEEQVENLRILGKELGFSEKVLDDVFMLVIEDKDVEVEEESDGEEEDN